MLFGYGSGSTSSAFTFKFKESSRDTVERIRDLNQLTNRLHSRIKLSPEEYTRRMAKRETDFISKDYTPSDSIDELPQGTFYVTKVDAKWRRFYNRKNEQNPKL